MSSCDGNGHGETEPDATGVGIARPLDAIKRIEDLFLLVPRNIGSPVLTTTTALPVSEVKLTSALSPY